MKKIKKAALSTVLAAVTAFSPAVPSFASYAEMNPVVSAQTSENDNVIYFDFSKSETVFVDTSNMEEVYLNSGARAQSLPYSGGVAFPSNVDFADTPLFLTSSMSNSSKIKFKPTKISEGGNKFSITIYAHYAGESSTTYHAIKSPTSTMYVDTTYSLGLGTGANSIDKFYLEFNRVSSCATSFNYTVSIGV